MGVDGLAAALGDAGLPARVDRHAAAVRDALHHAGREADAEGLAAYARSIVATARRTGRPVPEPGHAYVSGTAWPAAEWHLMRPGRGLHDRRVGRPALSGWSQRRTTLDTPGG